jgi:diguanylate cyclase (GGDEF)-like protein
VKFPFATLAPPNAAEPGLLREQYRSLTRFVPPMYGLILVITGLLVVAFLQSTPIWLSVAIPCAVSSVLVARMMRWIRLRQSEKDPSPDEMARACMTVVYGGSLISFVFAFVGVGLMYYGDQSQQPVAILLVWVLAILCSFCLHSVPSAAIFVVLATTTPMFLAFLLSDIEIRVFLLPVFAIVTAFVIYMVLEMNARFTAFVRTTERLEVSQAHVTLLAYKDTLTGLSNRLRFSESLDKALDQLRRDNRPFSLLCLDLDQFKEVNDTFGHAAGDDLIRVTAQIFAESCRPDDVIARLGGDEFAIILHRRTPAEVAVFADGLLEKMSKPIDIAVGRMFIGCSIGICSIDDPGLDGPECLRRADLALYRAKEAGRGRHVAFVQEMDATIRQRVQLRDELRHALEHEQLHVAYQPQARNGEILGVEALVRWAHPDRGDLSPAVFVPVAEESGLIEALGAYTLRQAFLDSHVMPGLTVAVNVSAAQLRLRGFVSRLQALLQETGADPARIELEITEGLLLGDDPATHQTLEAIRAMGLRIALDDFGTGYSSLSYLQRYPIDKIKIDRSFIANLGRETHADAVVAAIVRLARALRLDVVAEGVETETQRVRLLAAGCGDIQGYLFARPMPIHQLKELLAQAANVPLVLSDVA